MNYEELKNDPSIKWTKEPIVGLTMTMFNQGLTDSIGNPLIDDAEYWVGKHSSGYLVIFPVKGSLEGMLNGELLKSGRLN